jgi:hypothetical protein
MAIKQSFKHDIHHAEDSSAPGEIEGGNEATLFLATYVTRRLSFRATAARDGSGLPVPESRS